MVVRAGVDQADRDAQEVDVSKLVIFRGDSVETEMHLSGSTIRIGRDERNSIVLNDKSVSRFHAEVRAEGGTYYVVDLKSRNGLYVNGHQIKGKTALTLGVPVTLGAYELTLEDDLSTSEFGDSPPPSAGRTVVSTSAAEGSRRPNRSATQRMAAAQAPSAFFKKPALFYSAIGVATLVVCVLTYFLVRYIVRPRGPVETVAVATPAPTTTTVETAPDRTPEINQHLLAARDAFDAKQYDTALSELAAIEPLDPTNEQAAQLKQQIEQAKATPVTTTTVKPVVPATPEVTETPGIPKRTNEAPQDYTARATRVTNNYQDGKASAERQDFPAAIGKLEAVKRDQPGYRDVDALLAETQAKQRQHVDEAVGNGVRNDQAGKLADAVKWYQQALRFDPNSASAKEKLTEIQPRATKAGQEAYSYGEAYRKRGDDRKALEYYRQAVDLLPNGNEKTLAQQWLEKLK